MEQEAEKGFGDSGARGGHPDLELSEGTWKSDRSGPKKTSSPQRGRGTALGGRENPSSTPHVNKTEF